MARPRCRRSIIAAGIAGAGLVCGASALSSAPAPSCTAPLQPMQRIELMFGRNVRGHSGPGDRAWTRFLAREVTPRFPDGLTVLEGFGQWRDSASGRLAREPNKLVVIVTAAGAQVDDRIATIVAAYKQRFRQKSVGVVITAACAAF
jgi:hypothetical protein